MRDDSGRGKETVPQKKYTAKSTMSQAGYLTDRQVGVTRYTTS